jgi:hypothetical protein
MNKNATRTPDHATNGKNIFFQLRNVGLRIYSMLRKSVLQKKEKLGLGLGYRNFKNYNL